eukprot:5374284-Amphidinium_carterae.1
MSVQSASAPRQLEHNSEFVTPALAMRLASGSCPVPCAREEIANGMVAFHDAMKITYIPFPFPYAASLSLAGRDLHDHHSTYACVPVEKVYSWLR